MLFWVIALVLTLAVCGLLIIASRGSAAGQDVLSSREADMAVYRDQLAEVERDLARGVLSESEAEAVRLEVSRRLLDADKRGDTAAPWQGQSAGKALPVVLILAIAGGTLGLYVWLGAPGYGDLPIADRIAASERALANRPDQGTAEAEAAPNLPPAPQMPAETIELIDRLRAAVGENPDDPEGQRLLARNEARLGNLTAARMAQERYIALKGDAATLSERADLLDLMVLAAGGYVSPEAEALAEDILSIAPGNGVALYYIGLLQAQTGRADLAFPIWRRLLETSDPEAPWIPVIRAQIADLARAAGVQYTPPQVRVPSAADVAAAGEMNAEDRDAMIRGMVSGLADRLATQGGPVEDWARLITALGVLGEVQQAREIADEAEAVFAGDASALAQIEAARAGLPR